MERVNQLNDRLVRTPVKLLLASCCVLCFSISSASAYDIANRWTTTQTDGGGIARGDAITLLWSVVPDGESYSRAANSQVINYLDDGWNVAAIDRTPDLTNRPWWSWMDRVYDQYSRVSGITMIYTPEQTPAGVDTGNFGDVRIGGDIIDNNPGGTLADNAFPNNGDMRIDVSRDTNGDASFWHSNGPQLRNLIAHETGHGVGLNHSDITGANAVMETPLESNFWGLQFDDIYAINRSYGDPLEKNGGNDTFATASFLGSLSPGNSIVRGTDASDSVANENDDDWIGIDGTTDEDWFRVTIPQIGSLSIDLRPQGPTYTTTTQGLFNAKAQADLRFQLYQMDGTTLVADVDATGLGEEERLAPISIATPGDYLVRVDATNDLNQFYELDITVGSPVVLTANRNTGELAITSPLGNYEFDAYTITSASGSLNNNNGAWNSLQDQGVTGWSEALSSSTQLAELQPQGSTVVSPTIPRSLGEGFEPNLTGVPFGTNPNDLVLQIRNATTGETEQAVVEYIGNGLINNLVLTIDPNSGDAMITNESITTINLDSYTIASESGSLLVDWDSLADQGEPGWQEAAPTTDRISELNPSDAFTLAGGASFIMEGLWNTLGIQDLADLSFLFRDTTLGTFTGVIEFDTFFTADFDGDGDVDADDLAQWQGDYGLNGDSDANGDGLSNGADFLAWQRQFGSGVSQASASAALPEPTSFLIATIFAAIGLSRRNSRRNSFFQDTYHSSSIILCS